MHNLILQLENLRKKIAARTVTPSDWNAVTPYIVNQRDYVTNRIFELIPTALSRGLLNGFPNGNPLWFTKERQLENPADAQTLAALGLENDLHLRFSDLATDIHDALTVHDITSFTAIELLIGQGKYSQLKEVFQFTEASFETYLKDKQEGNEPPPQIDLALAYALGNENKLTPFIFKYALENRIASTIHQQGFPHAETYRIMGGGLCQDPTSPHRVLGQQWEQFDWEQADAETKTAAIRACANWHCMHHIKYFPDITKYLKEVVQDPLPLLQLDPRVIAQDYTTIVQFLSNKVEQSKAKQATQERELVEAQLKRTLIQAATSKIYYQMGNGTGLNHTPH